MGVNKVTRTIIGTIITVVIMMMFSSILKGNFNLQSIIEYAAFIVIVLVIFLTSLYRVWVACIMASLCFPQLLHLPIIYRIPIGILFVMVISGLFILKGIIKHDTIKVKGTISGKLMALLGVVIVGRFLVDRPGLAMSGGVGGAGEAFLFLLGVFCYFMTMRIVAAGWEPKPNLKTLILFVTLANIIFIISIFLHGFMYGITSLFSTSVWFLCSLLATLAFSAHKRNPTIPKVVAVWGIIIFTMGISILSPHRSSPIFGFAIIMVVAYLYGYGKKVILYLFPPILVLTTILIMAGSGSLPSIVARSLSIIVPMSTSESYDIAHEYGSSTETGWESSFRGYLYKIAWGKIKQHPIVGSGVKVGQDDLYYAYTFSWSIEDAAKKLAISGVYHNSLLEMTVFFGIPAALLFLFVYIIDLKRYFVVILKDNNNTEKVMKIAILGFFTAMSGKMLMNGDAKIFVSICVMLGFSRGIYALKEQEKQKATVELTSSDNQIS